MISTLVHGTVCDTLNISFDSHGRIDLAHPSISTSTMRSCSRTRTSLHITAAEPIFILMLCPGTIASNCRLMSSCFSCSRIAFCSCLVSAVREHHSESRRSLRPEGLTGLCAGQSSSSFRNVSVINGESSFVSSSFTCCSTCHRAHLVFSSFSAHVK